MTLTAAPAGSSLSLVVIVQDVTAPLNAGHSSASSASSSANPTAPNDGFTLVRHNRRPNSSPTSPTTPKAQRTDGTDASDSDMEADEPLTLSPSKASS